MAPPAVRLLLLPSLAGGSWLSSSPPHASKSCAPRTPPLGSVLYPEPPSSLYNLARLIRVSTKLDAKALAVGWSECFDECEPRFVSIRQARDSLQDQAFFAGLSVKLAWREFEASFGSKAQTAFDLAEKFKGWGDALVEGKYHPAPQREAVVKETPVSTGWRRQFRRVVMRSQLIFSALRKVGESVRTLFSGSMIPEAFSSAARHSRAAMEDESEPRSVDDAEVPAENEATEVPAESGAILASSKTELEVEELQLYAAQAKHAMEELRAARMRLRDLMPAADESVSHSASHSTSQPISVEESASKQAQELRAALKICSQMGSTVYGSDLKRALQCMRWSQQ